MHRVPQFRRMEWRRPLILIYALIWRKKPCNWLQRMAHTKLLNYVMNCENQCHKRDGGRSVLTFGLRLLTYAKCCDYDTRGSSWISFLSGGTLPKVSVRIMQICNNLNIRRLSGVQFFQIHFRNIQNFRPPEMQKRRLKVSLLVICYMVYTTKSATNGP